jgi:hypothetical protein
MTRAGEPAFQTAQRAFAAHLRNPAAHPAPSLPEERVAVYRYAVRHNIAEFMASNFPRLKDAMAAEAWQRLIDDYLAHHPARTAAFARLPGEFLDFLQTRREHPDQSPFLEELAHFEWLENHLCCDERVLPDPSTIDREGDLLCDEIIVNPIHTLVTYSFPVHVFDDTSRPDAAPPRPTHLVAFRDWNFGFAVLDLNPLSRELFEAVSAPQSPPAGKLLVDFAARLSHASPDAVIQGGAEILARMRHRQLILGTRSRTNAVAR